MDLIKREDAIKAVSEPFDRKYWQYTTRSIRDTVKALKDIPSAEKQGEWIPVKWHEITDKEREEEGYPEEWSVFIDSVMPNDGERILVTTKHGEVEIDTCCEDDGFYLDSGWDWVDDIVAWMPLPELWEGADNGRK